MYVVPNHMLNQFAREFLDAYPAANIMVADENAFHTSNRRRFMAQAALNDPDAVIVSHSSFGKIGTSSETRARGGSVHL
jgi:N12 class adenine-specific DNA methylase